VGEYFRDELAKTCKRKQPRFIGFGQDYPAFTGVAVTGRANRMAVKYLGVGVYNVMGICPQGWTAATWASVGAGMQFYSWAVYDMFNRPILDQSFSAPISINGIYDLLDEGIYLLPQEFLVVEFTSYSAVSRGYGGFLWGDEYLF